MTSDPLTGRPWSLRYLERLCEDLPPDHEQRPPMRDECVVPRAALRALCRLVREVAHPTFDGGYEHDAALGAFEVEP